LQALNSFHKTEPPNKLGVQRNVVTLVTLATPALLCSPDSVGRQLCPRRSARSLPPQSPAALRGADSCTEETPAG